MNKHQLCILLALLFPNAVFATDTAPGENYAAIEVGASGIKGVVVQTVKSESDGPPAKVMKEYVPIDKNAFIWDAAASGKISAAVAEMHKEMQKDFSIPGHHLFVYGSSGLTSDVKGILKDTIIEDGAKIEFITPEQEEQLTFMGIVPANRLHQVVVLDIGSGNTKGTYLQDTDFVPYDIAWGTKSWAKEIDRTRGDGSFQIAADVLRREKLIPAVRVEVQQKPGLQNIRRVYLAGGIVWAMVTLLHPYDNSETWVRISVDDIDEFYEKARTNPTALLSPDLDRVPSGMNSAEAQKIRAKVSKEIARLGTIFNQDQLLAGAQILKVFKEEMYFERKDAIFFARHGLYALPVGYVLGKLPSAAARTNQTRS
jgi:hypothetical protein